MTCTTTGCNGGASACCRTQRPTCVVALTEPQASAARYYGGVFDPNETCVGPTGSTTCPGTQMYVYWTRRAGVDACAPASALTVMLTRPLAAANTTFTLPASGVYLSLSSAGQFCLSWTGTLTWHSDLPAWRVSINATCADPGMQDLRVVGELSGEA
jgi:hypothetical protein